MGKDFDFEKLKGNDNYHTWCFAMRNYLTFKGYQDAIVRIVVPSTSTTPAATKCKEDDAEKCSKAQAILSLSVDTSIYVHINKCTNALETWECLQKLYEEKGLSRKIGLFAN